ncbi:GAF domain-containing protein [Belnapia sp. T6]|uniref:histidine kinase n=1 Tax=Belnapia mucosa TaxID=2804532 RepID=A0ABS1VCD5_9PROT|nr:GAF domain-containing protein [Belnapia mucosa]MBL6459313.1 GAF domain-containing protein [Belnapia mucosa]
MAELAGGQPTARLCRVAARLLGTPMAGISLVGEEMVHIRTAFGLDAGTIPRAGSFCDITVSDGFPLVVPDALEDPRFLTNPAVIGPPGFRFYAGAPLLDSQGRPIGALFCCDTMPHPASTAPDDLAALQDLAILVTDALRHEAEAERLAEHFHAVVEAVPLPLMAIDAMGLVTDWNRAAEQVFGWTAAEAIGRFGPHVPPGEADAARALRAKDGERLVGVEAERMRRDGTRLPVSISSAPLRDRMGRPEGAVVVVEDISERRRAEAEAAAHTARTERQAALLTRIAAAMPAAGEDTTAALQGIAEAAVRGLEGCDAGVWLREADGGFCLLTLVGHDGLPLPEVSPKRSALARLPNTRTYLAALMADREIAAEDAATDPRVADLREAYIQPFGIGALLSAPIRAGQEVLGLVSACAEGAPRRWTAEERAFMASLADLGAVALESGRRAQAMARLAAERDRAEAASRAKSLVLGTLSHELRTPLNAIIGFSELLQQPSLREAERLEFAGHVVAAGRHLLGVFNAMLDQARIESGALVLAEAPLPLPQLLHDAVGLVLTEATARGIRIETRAAEPIPLLRGDAGRLRQALANLLANAVKFSPDGGCVELSAEFCPASGFRIAVADQGPGMDAAELPRAFEPFRQLDEGLRRRAGGAGLGLPLAKAFVEAHGGTLTLDTTKGQGTRATITLPPGRALAA